MVWVIVSCRYKGRLVIQKNRGQSDVHGRGRLGIPNPASLKQQEQTKTE